jgi:tRNA G18 (ribose-2'-O)-methylase SpoU
MKKLSMDELQRIGVEEYKEANKLPLIVVLDNVRSLNNVGSVFRTADAFRVSKVVLCGITAQPPHRDIHKTALGAENSVEWEYYSSTEDCVKSLLLQGYKVYAVEQADESVMLDNFEVEDGDKIAVVMGNEVDGVDDEVVEMCNGCIEIPQYGTKHSLNVSIAAGIVMWDMFKKLRKGVDF